MTPSNPSWFDLIFVLLIVLYIAYCVACTRRTREQMRSGILSRGRVYSEIVLVQWSHVLILGLIWRLADRPSADLGMAASLSETLSSFWGVGAWVIGLGTGIFLLYKIWDAGRSAEARQQIREQVDEFDFMLPRTRGELRGFTVVGLTASLCEEIIFRGFLLWWFQAALGLGLLPAAAASTVIFSLGHAYQGWQGVIRVGLIGTLLMAVRLAAGALWPAMVLHAAMDLLGGWLIYRSRPEIDPADPPQASGSVELEPVKV